MDGEPVWITSVKFQSTLPLRGATDTRVSTVTAFWVISIHAPLAGSDFLVRRFPIF